MSLTWRCGGSGASADGGRSLIYPPLVTALEALLEPAPYAFFAIWGRRSMAEQEALHKAHLAGGPLAAPPGRSAHNYDMAVDVAVDLDAARPGLQPGWDIRHPAWQWLRDATKDHPTIYAGWWFPPARRADGTRRSRVDPPHLEWRGWRKLVTLQVPSTP